MALCYLRHDHGCCLSTRDVCLFAPLSVCIPVLYVLMYCVITGILYVLLLYVFYSYVLSLHDCIEASLFSLNLTDLSSFSYLNSIFFLSFFVFLINVL